MLTVRQGGWDLHATIRVFMEYSSLWTVEFVSVSHAGLERAVIHYAWDMGCVDQINVFATH